MTKLLPSLLVASGLLLTSLPHQAAAQLVPARQWDKTFGGTSDERLADAQQTSDGGYILGGHSTSNASGDKTQPSQGSADYWVVKLDASGTKQWDRTFGGNNFDHPNALQQTSDGGYILGGHSTSNASGDKTQPSQGGEDYWVVKLGADGTKQWDRSFGGSGADYATTLQQTSDGGYLLGGISNSGISGDKAQPSQGGEDYWVLKLSATPLATTPAPSRLALAAYPNPTTTAFIVHGPAGTPYQLLNQLGQIVRRGRVSSQRLDVQGLPAGLYLLRNELTGSTSKLVKQ
ncbi:T9SS type A sorting domain-containing protein [uncultured Hymenobacter sp.]|uniref:T9SS type A sorting domain-containing protein n=1 Tax=uncultured Hymenobacter sp. TaxID=170016 RepID=UPI0035CB2D20